ncbi:TonB-dependent receptor [Bacteroides sp. UBA939]|uniref:TonB-dependent receptor n=1 Tax=Bacteroides sp. UBA939 TaxID=1946092 RepID=UPI0025C2BDCF|nr:carboxypeptidase regulatory-like domain-containing protein [Bacteroides sp. UBA939]
MKRIKHLLAITLLLVSTFIYGQVTTSSMAGRVTDGTETLIGATITATHMPSGTVYGTVTNVDGRYTIQGMRVGGPYEVKASYVGYATSVVTDITLQLAETYNQNFELKEDVNLLGEVVVSAKASKFAAEKTGTSTNISNTQIINMPSISRSITDYTRLSPYGGNGMTFAGADGRTANFTVDGANFNNNFGLSDGLPGGGSPISIDAIEEMQVVIAPYDVRQTNFIGGGVNAITKSGTNTFKGSLYTYQRNENMRGDAVAGQQIPGAREVDRTSTYGLTFGGPIIKNKLFFFVNAEMVKIPSIANRWRASEDGVADPDNYLSRATVSDLQRVSDFVKERYGYDTGSFTKFPADESNYKILARLDWNINDKNRLALRYNYTKNRFWNAPNATSMDGGTRMSGSRMSQYSMSYANSMYGMDNLVNSFSANLNSRLSERLSNEFLATYSSLNDLRSTNSDEFPFIDILKDDQSYISLGYELFTYNNAVHNNVWNIKDELTYYVGNHKIVGGLSYEYKMADNQYMRNGTGYYRYRSLDDFLTGAAPEIVNLTYGYDGETKPAARVRTNKISAYAQDDWNINEKFKLTYGLRIDGLFFNNSDLMTNKAIYDLDYNGRHIDTGKWPGANLIFSPRVGFTWDVFGNKSLKLRGGTGFFAGNLPLVFFTNMPTNGGMVQYQAQINAAEAARRGFTMDEFAGGLVKDANGKASVGALLDKLHGLKYPKTVKPEDGVVPSAVNGVDPDFKMPQVWKTSFAVDYVIPVSFPFTVSVEGIFNKTLNGVSISDWSIPNVGGFARFNGVDNRPIYPAGYRTNTKAFMLENTNRGYGWSFTTELNAQPTEWLSLMAAYTHTVAKDVTGMPGSAAESAFTYVPTVEGPNNIKLHNSQYVTPDRFIFNATVHDKSGNHYSLIYETWRGGYNYSYMTANDMNGDGYNYDAVYVPTDKEVADNQFRFINEDNKKRFMDYVHNNDYLKSRQGKYTEAYSLYSPWVHRVDFSYKHDFTVMAGKNKNTLQLSFDMKNVLNFFNSSWGVSKGLNPEIGSDPRILKYEGVDADGYATFSTPASIHGKTKTFTNGISIGQCWYVSIGVRYTFN